MIDISAVGSKVTIKPRVGSTIVVTEFSDEGTPFESADIDVSTNAKNLNGQMVSSRTPSVYPLSITVIPGSDADFRLQNLLQASALFPGNVRPVDNLIIDYIEVSIPRINESQENSTTNDITYKWMNGRIKSGPTGPSTSAEGRLSSRTYTFEMEKFDGVSGNPVRL